MNQNSELTRVQDRLNDAVLDFVVRVPVDADGDRTFRMDTLRKAVEKSLGPIAPDSPGRILRQLRLDGRADYVVVNRRASLYKLV